MIARGRESYYYFIDGTFHRPKPYSKLLIILFKDIIIKEKIPLFFILMSNRREELYKRIFNSIIEILTQNYIYVLPLMSIITDIELPLINSVESTFIGVQRIGCFYHLKDNLEKYANSMGLLNKNHQYVKIEETKEVIFRLGNLSVEYDGNMEYLDDEIKKMKMQISINLHCLITVIQDITCVIFLYEDCKIFFLFSI